METQIIKLEKQYWEGMENHDYEAVRELTFFPCIVAGKNGVQSIDETMFKKMFESGEGNKIKVLNISDTKEQLLSEDTVIIGYSIEFEGSEKASSKCVCTSTWTKKGDKWLCAMHTETEFSK